MSEAYSQPFAIAQKGEANLIAGAFGDVRGGIEVAEANARLIASAPELLEALRNLMERAEAIGQMPGEPTELESKLFDAAYAARHVMYKAIGHTNHTL